MLQSRRFKYALLRTFAIMGDEADDGGWLLYKRVMEEAFEVGVEDFGLPRDTAYSTCKNARGDLVRKGMLEQKKEKGHFYLRLTDLGRRYEAKIPGRVAAENDEVVLPEMPFRFGKGHLLTPAFWKKTLAALYQGEIDFYAVPHNAEVTIFLNLPAKDEEDMEAEML